MGAKKLESECSELDGGCLIRQESKQLESSKPEDQQPYDELEEETPEHQLPVDVLRVLREYCNTFGSEFVLEYYTK